MYFRLECITQQYSGGTIDVLRVVGLGGGGRSIDGSQLVLTTENRRTSGRAYCTPLSLSTHYCTATTISATATVTATSLLTSLILGHDH
ncbi:hypothetical protein J6590_050929 [Homalodisca vitripennis]|nr:hypothetical protein J6590_050929 [Homalodisca vitripennis]